MGGVERVAVVDQLHHHVLAPEPLDKLVHLRPRGSWSVGEECLADRAFAAAGQHHGVAAQFVDDLLQVVDRFALLLAAQVGVGDHPAHPPVALHLAAQD